MGLQSQVGHDSVAGEAEAGAVERLDTPGWSATGHRHSGGPFENVQFLGPQAALRQRCSQSAAGPGYILKSLYL